MPNRQLTLTTLLLIASAFSCKDAGVPIELSEIIDTECGSYELFKPENNQGEYYYITGVRVFPLDRRVLNGISGVYYCKTLTGQLAFSAQTEYRRLTSEQLKTIPNLTSDPIPGQVVNPIKFGIATMQFNRDISFREETIPAGTNLVGRIPIKSGSFYFPLAISPFALHEIHMSRNDFSVNNGDYKLMVTWETFDSIVIRDTVDVTFAFN